MRFPARRFSMMFFSSSLRSGGMSTVIFWPTISTAWYPSIRQADAFQDVIVPSSVFVMMASSVESTTAARSARASPCSDEEWDPSSSFCPFTLLQLRYGRARLYTVARRPDVGVHGLDVRD